MCTLADNTFIRFGEYSVVDYDSRMELLSVSAEHNEFQDNYARQRELEGTLTLNDRQVKHSFSADFFKL